MKVVTAPEKPNYSAHNHINVFLSGGITGCPEWQQEVIDALKEYEKIYDLSHVYIFNPKRENFDVNNYSDAVEQIKWEHKWLERCDIFSCFFSGRTDSVQPITLYELGKYSRSKNSVITVEDGYSRKSDILLQTALDGLFCQTADSEHSAYVHARGIAVAIKNLMKEGYR